MSVQVLRKYGKIRPRPSLESVLGDVNRIRLAAGKVPLTKMPKGVPQSYRSCPLAKALNKRVLMFGPTQRLDNFIDYFDRGAYPELVSGPRRATYTQSGHRA